MSRNFGEVDGNLRSWEFRCKSYDWSVHGYFPKDSDDADLMYFSLIPHGGQLDFWLSHCPKRIQISLTIHVKIIDVKGKVYCDDQWKVKNLGGTYKAVELECSSPFDDGFRTDTWAAHVTISCVKRTACDGERAVAFRLPTATESKDTRVPDPPGISSTSTAPKSTNNRQMASVSKKVWLETDSTEDEDDDCAVSPLSHKGADGRKTERSALNTSNLTAATASESNGSEIEEENLQRNSTASVLSVLAKFNAEANTKLSEQTAELNQLRLNYGRLESECKAQAEQLQTERESVKSQQAEIVNLREKNENLEAKLVDLQNCLDQQQVSFGDISDTISEPNPHECSEPRAKKRKMSQSASDDVGINAAPVAVGIPWKVKVETITIEDDPPVYPGWPADCGDFLLISADGYGFYVSKGDLKGSRCRESPVFKALLSSNYGENKQGRVETIFNGEVVVELLKYLYGDEFTPNLSVVAEDLYVAADYYSLDALKNLCANEVGRQLSFASLNSTLTLANRIPNSQPLKDKCLQFILSHRKSLFLGMEDLYRQFPGLSDEIRLYAAAKSQKTRVSARIQPQ